MKRPGLIVVGVLIGLLFIALQLFFMVREGEVAVLTTLGRPVGAHTEAGLYGRKPWPVQRVYTFDNRRRILETSYEETLTADGKNVLVGLYAAWRIDEPIRFLERVGSVGNAVSNLDGLLRTHKSAAIGRYPFSSLVNVDSDALRFAAIEEEILESVRPDAEERYGIEVVTLGIHRLGLPEPITESVFERMRAERNKIAEQYRSEGEGEAIKILARAKSERDQMLSKAQADAKRIRADGEAIAADFYEVFEQDIELAIFLRKLEGLEEMMSERSTAILSTETEPFDILRGGPSVLPGGDQEDGGP